MYIYLLVRIDTKEHELYRVFDSLAFEEEDNHNVETGCKTDGAFDENQTREIMYLIKIFTGRISTYIIASLTHDRENTIERYDHIYKYIYLHILIYIYISKIKE